MLNLPVLSGAVDLMVTPSCCAAMVVLLKVKVVVTKPWMPVFTRGTTDKHRLEVVLAGIPGLDDGLAGVEVEQDVGRLARRHIEVGLQLQAALLAAGRVQRDQVAARGLHRVGHAGSAGAGVARQHQADL